MSRRFAAKKKQKHHGYLIGLVIVSAVIAGLAFLALQPSPPSPLGTTTSMLSSTTIMSTRSLASSSTLPATERPIAFDFTLQDVNGKVLKLSDFRGSVVVLEFMSTTCPHCIAEMPQLTAVWNGSNESIVIISIDLNSGDTDESLKNFAASYNAPLIWRRDTANVWETYQVRGVPTILIIDANGRIAYASSGETSAETLLQQIRLALQVELND